MRPSKLTSRQKEEFRQLYPVTKIKDLTTLFGIHRSTVERIARKLGITQSELSAKYGHNRKRVMQMRADGKPIRIYNNTKEAARALGRPFGYIYIREVCRGLHSTAWGYKWKYV